MNNKINTLGLFSGGGGLDLGVSASGFNVVLSSDIDVFSCKTLQINQGKRAFFKKHPVLCENIRNLNKEIIKQEINNQEIDFIIGGPPCQAFSIFGKRQGLNDPRGDLVFEYARIVKEVKPEAFVFENVAGLKTIHNGELYNTLLDVLSIEGEYTITAHEYEVADFGIPQFRKRVFFVGSKSGKKIPQMKPTHVSPESLCNGYKPYITVAHALKGLTSPIINWNNEPQINGHVGRKHSERIINRYKSLSHGERDTKTRINKLNPNRPSFTIIVGSDSGGGKGHIHPFDAREVTPRESARLQTFPDWWEFSGTGRHIIRQVGNAVPPLFAAILSNYLAKELFDINFNLKTDEIIYKLELDFLTND